MQIAYDLEGLHALVPQLAPHAATIGNFDGVHLGHRQLLRHVRQYAQAEGVPAAAITFDPHPLRVINGLQLPDLLTSTAHKLELLAQEGMDLALVLPFNREMAALTPEAFVRTVMVDGLRLRHLVIGYDYALGKGRAGNYAALTDLGGRYGFTVQQIPPVVVDGATVSSSLIRERVKAGVVDRVRPLLGRLHSLDGRVVRGQGRGRTLGFPTANIELGDLLLPPPGVYATWAEILPQARAEAYPTVVSGEKTASPAYMSVTSIGTNPTFDGQSLTLEVHLLDRNEDLYDKTMRVHFAARLRDAARFSSVDELVQQITSDAHNARAYLCTNSL